MKYGPFKRKKDWHGKTAELLRECTTNGGDTYAVGTRFTVHALGAGTYHLFQKDPCPHCGHKGSIRIRTGSQPFTFRLVEEE